MKKIFFAACVVALGVGQSAWADCAHPYFPTKVGTEWHFQDNQKNEHVIKVLKSEGKKVLLEGTFIDPENKDNELKSNFSAYCDDSGFKMLIAEMFVTAAPSGMGGLKASFEDTSGVTLPPPAKMKVGESWNQSTTMVFGTAEMPAAMKATMKIKNEIVGKEKVTVAAGTFDAFKIQFTSQTQMAMPGMPVPMGSAGNMSGSGTLWVAKGVGVVKHTDSAQTGNGQSSETTTELVKVVRKAK